jgi:hypothetical protein
LGATHATITNLAYIANSTLNEGIDILAVAANRLSYSLTAKNVYYMVNLIFNPTFMRWLFFGWTVAKCYEELELWHKSCEIKEILDRSPRI